MVEKILVTKQKVQQIKRQKYQCENKHIFQSETESDGYTPAFKEHAVYIYLRSLSLNVAVDIIQEQYEARILTKKTLLGFVISIAKSLPTLDDIDGIYHPVRSGYIAVDGVWFSLAGKKFVLLVAFDPDTFDIIAYHHDTDETQKSYEELITKVTNKLGSASIKGLYADGDRGFLSAWKLLLPQVPFQLCVFHKELRMGQKVPVKLAAISKQMTEERKQELKEFQQLFRNTIYADSKEHAWKALEVLEKYVRGKSDERFTTAYNSLKYNFIHTLTHFEYPHMKRDNNMIECFNGILKTRLRLMKGFKSEENRDLYLTLFLLNYRFQPSKESRNEERRGRSPIENTGVVLSEYFNFLSLLRSNMNLKYTENIN